MHLMHVQGDSGGKVSILGHGNIGHFEEKIHVSMCLIVVADR